MSKIVLVAEGDPDWARLLERVIAEAGDSTCTVRTAATARKAALRGGFDVIVLDAGLPDGDGVELCAELRRDGVKTPILLLLTSPGTPARVRGLRKGADDCLAKPFDVEELLLRLGVLARRERSTFHLHAGAIDVDLRSRRASINGKLLSLTGKELDVLVCLGERLGQVVERGHILERVWNLSNDGSGVLDVHVSRLRDKLGQYAWMVETVRGIGLRLRAERSSTAG